MILNYISIRMAGTRLYKLLMERQTDTTSLANSLLVTYEVKHILNHMNKQCYPKYLHK